jgi:hypothetical protein
VEAAIASAPPGTRECFRLLDVGEQVEIRG